MLNLHPGKYQSSVGIHVYTVFPQSDATAAIFLPSAETSGDYLRVATT